jgi:HAD superfamily hydrolase (TIGR01509 family)
MTIAAVVFDMDGVLVDSEAVWDEARHEIAVEHGGRWPEDAQRTMMGMSSREWSRYMHEDLGVELPPEEISERVVARLSDLYRDRLPLIDGARATVAALAGAWPLALASSANRPIIDLVLELAGLADRFEATVSSEEVERGKPAPDVYLEAARRLGVPAASCAAVEDSSNGLRSAAAAGMRVVAVPNAAFPPDADALALAHRIIPDLTGLGVAEIRALSEG